MATFDSTQHTTTGSPSVSVTERHVLRTKKTMLTRITSVVVVLVDQMPAQTSSLVCDRVIGLSRSD